MFIFYCVQTVSIPDLGTVAFVLCVCVLNGHAKDILMSSSQHFAGISIRNRLHHHSKTTLTHY